MPRDETIFSLLEGHSPTHNQASDPPSSLRSYSNVNPTTTLELLNAVSPPRGYPKTTDPGLSGGPPPPNAPPYLERSSFDATWGVSYPSSFYLLHAPLHLPPA